MRKSAVLIVALLAGALHTFAASDYSAIWQKGNSYYQQKIYDSAALCFEQIASTRPQNAEIYYNLGNTYYRLNKPALAVLNYERALRINPDYADAKENLLLAQSRVSNHIVTAGDIFFVSWWQQVTRPQNATAWAVAALIAFTLVIVVVLLRRLKVKGASGIPVQVQGILIAIFCCFLVLSFFSSLRSRDNETAVVMETDAPLMNMDQKGKPLTLVPEGTVVKIISDKGNWLEVRLPDGRSGWIQQSLIAKI